MSVVFEDLAEGQRLDGGARTITDAEVAFLPLLMGASNPLFHDDTAAVQSPLGRRVLYGPALLGIAIALTEPLFHGTAMGLLGLDAVRFRSAVGVGDTVRASLQVTELRARPGKPGGIVTVHDQAVNAAGETVLEFQRTLMLRQRTG